MDVTIWTDAPGTATAASVIESMDSLILVKGVGGPRGKPIDELAARLQCPRDDDFRKLLVDHPASFVLLTTAAGVNLDDIAVAIGQGATVLSYEPVSAKLDAWQTVKPRTITGKAEDAARSASMTSPPAWLDGRLLHIPAFRRCPAWSSAADPLQALGTLRSLSMITLGRPGEGSLFARLHDAWDALLSFTGLPETIDAAIVAGPLTVGAATNSSTSTSGASGAAISTSTPSDLARITGHLSALGRFADGSAITIHASDRAGSSLRELRVLGDAGQLRLGEQDYELFATTGQLLDSREPQPPQDFVTQVVTQWKSLLDRRPVSNPVEDARRAMHALACCSAALLSSQTGQPESPRHLLHIHGQEG